MRTGIPENELYRSARVKRQVILDCQRKVRRSSVPGQQHTSILDGNWTTDYPSAAEHGSIYIDRTAPQRGAVWRIRKQSASVDVSGSGVGIHNRHPQSALAVFGEDTTRVAAHDTA